MEQIVTWRQLNETLRTINTESEAKALYDSLIRNPHTTARWKQRAYSRYSKLRRRRERKEINAQGGTVNGKHA